jgi:hypothetical protein
MATDWPASTTNETSSRTICSSKRNVTWRNSSRPSMASGDSEPVTASASLIPGGSSSTSSMRPHDARPRWAMFVTHPNAIIGQLSMAR